MATKWYKALNPDELPEGRVMTVTLGNESICMTHYDGKYGALNNRCPHQGGPLGEGSIENGLLRCPWHGWDYCPQSGKPPGDFDDGVPTYDVEVRDDGIYVAIEELPGHEPTVADVMIGTMVNWGVKWCFGMVGHSNLYVADALRRQEADGRLTYIGIRHEGAASFACSAYGKLTGRPASCLAIAGPGATNLSGDGGFGQYLADFTTAVKFGMNVTHVLLHNDELGKISKEQRAGQWDVWQTSLHNPDFAAFASNCGGLGIRVTSADQLDDAYRWAFDHDGPALVEIMSDAELI